VKQRDLVSRVARAARLAGVVWRLDRRGARHDVYALDGLVVPIPRHGEIKDVTAEGIFRECEPVLGEGWWRA